MHSLRSNSGTIPGLAPDDLERMVERLRSATVDFNEAQSPVERLDHIAKVRALRAQLRAAGIAPLFRRR